MVAAIRAAAASCTLKLASVVRILLTSPPSQAEGDYDNIKGCSKNSYANHLYRLRQWLLAELLDRGGGSKEGEWPQNSDGVGGYHGDKQLLFLHSTKSAFLSAIGMVLLVFVLWVCLLFSVLLMIVVVLVTCRLMRRSYQLYYGNDRIIIFHKSEN